MKLLEIPAHHVPKHNQMAELYRSTAETGGVEESTYNGFMSPMDRTTQVVGSTKERMARLE